MLLHWRVEQTTAAVIIGRLRHLCKVILVIGTAAIHDLLLQLEAVSIGNLASGTFLNHECFGNTINMKQKS